MLGRKQEGKNLTLELRELKGLEGSSEMNRNRRDLTRRFRPKQFLLPYEAVCLSPPFWGARWQCHAPECLVQRLCLQQAKMRGTAVLAMPRIFCLVALLQTACCAFAAPTARGPSSAWQMSPQPSVMTSSPGFAWASTWSATSSKVENHTLPGILAARSFVRTV